MSAKWFAALGVMVVTSVGGTPRLLLSQSFECQEVMVPMRDGVRLATDVYVPRQGVGPWPVILQRTPYDKRACNYEDAKYYAARGYAVVVQDERGRYRSEGEYYWWRDYGWGERQDGYDAIEWAGTQPWSNGKVGTMGLSYPCINQYMTAPTQPPHLVAMFCSQGLVNAYKELMYREGAFSLRLFPWLAGQRELGPGRMLDGLAGEPATPETWLKWYTQMKESGLTFREAILSPMVRDYLDNPYYNDYWRQFAVDEQVEKINVPIFHYGSTYDRYTKPQTDFFNAVRKRGGPGARDSQKLMLGPWVHGAGHITNRVIGDLDFGPEAAIDYFALRLRWFDYHLKGIENGLYDEPPIRLFVMGDNTWRDENEIPLARTVYTDYFLRTGPSGSINSLNDGLLSTQRPGDERPTSFQYDPLRPVPSIGGDLFLPGLSGARDHRPADRLSLTFTTPPLEADIEITGMPRIVFFVSSSAVDTDWVVTITDVHPNGYSQPLNQKMLRARMREGYERPVFITPGEVYEFTLELHPISNVFKKGHLVRIVLTSSSFPRFMPNDNTGKELDETTEVVVATNTVYHDRTRPTRVILPLIPKR